MGEAAVQGWLVAVSLILAIGAQNAFVLRQGLRREHVLAVVLVCAASDAVLIAAGVTGFGLVSARLPWLGEAMRWAGVAFLLVYGGLRLRAAARGGEALRPAAGEAAPLGRVLATCLVLTWANPHGTLFLFTAADGSTQSMTRRMRDRLVSEGSLRVVPDVKPAALRPSQPRKPGQPR